MLDRRGPEPELRPVLALLFDVGKVMYVFICHGIYVYLISV